MKTICKFLIALLLISAIPPSSVSSSHNPVEITLADFESGLDSRGSIGWNPGGLTIGGPWYAWEQPPTPNPDDINYWDIYTDNDPYDEPVDYDLNFPSQNWSSYTSLKIKYFAWRDDGNNTTLDEDYYNVKIRVYAYDADGTGNSDNNGYHKLGDHSGGGTVTFDLSSMTNRDQVVKLKIRVFESFFIGPNRVRQRTHLYHISLLGNRIITYGPAPMNLKYFGQSVLHEPGWDRYLMYLSMNSSIVNGKPANTAPGDPGTYNQQCGTWWADRIWLTWHFGDGKTPTGWNANDGYGNIPPILMLNIGGPGESGLIGDPAVVYWNGQWHMYYEGTDWCDGSHNNIFHATAPSWFGPWTKQGPVWGLWGLHGQPPETDSGFSWPTVLIENNQLYLYFTDGHVRLLAAWAMDNTGHSFYMMNYNPNQALGATNPAPVLPITPTVEMANRGQVVKVGNQYKLIYDNFGRTQIKVSVSNNKFSFPVGSTVLTTQASNPLWENVRVGLPSYLLVSGEERVYYTGEGTQSPASIGIFLLP